MKRFYTVLLLTLCFMAPSFIYAGDLGMYGSLKLGLFMPNSDFHGDSWGYNSFGHNFDGMSGFDNVPIYGLAMGMKINPNIAVEVGWEMYETELKLNYHNTDMALLTGATADDTSKYKIKTWSIPVTGKLLMPVSNKITAFLGAGLGYYKSEVDATETLTINGVNTVINGTGSDSQDANGFGLHALAGADFMVDANVSFGLELKWSNAKLDFDDFNFAFDNNIDFKYHMDRDTNVGGTSLSLTAKYSF